MKETELRSPSLPIKLSSKQVFKGTSVKRNSTLTKVNNLLPVNNTLSSSTLLKPYNQLQFPARKPNTNPNFSCKIPKLNEIKLKINVKQKTNMSRNLFKSNSAFLSKSLLNITVHQNDIEEKYFKFSSLTRTGTIDGVEKENNQDRMLEREITNDGKSLYLFAVFDGHGANGHFVSNFAKSYLPRCIENHLYDFQKNKNKISVKGLRESVSELVESLDRSSIDIKFSGTTLLSVLIHDLDCWCINIGDSRGIIAAKNNSWEYLALNKEHKPDDPEEKKRIEEYGGRVGYIKDTNGNPAGPVRAWSCSLNSPGIAMSRSVGDKFANTFGVIPVPDITYFKLSPDDKFFVLASDGLWDNLSNMEVVNIVSKFSYKKDSDAANQMLIKEAVKSAKKKGCYIDDISVITIFRL